MRTLLINLLARFLAFIEYLADSIFLSSEDTDPETLATYQSGKARLAELQADLSRLKKDATP